MNHTGAYHTRVSLPPTIPISNYIRSLKTLSFTLYPIPANVPSLVSLLNKTHWSFLLKSLCCLPALLLPHSTRALPNCLPVKALFWLLLHTAKPKGPVSALSWPRPLLTTLLRSVAGHDSLSSSYLHWPLLLSLACPLLTLLTLNPGVFQGCPGTLFQSTLNVWLILFNLMALNVSLKFMSPSPTSFSLTPDLYVQRPAWPFWYLLSISQVQDCTHDSLQPLLLLSPPAQQQPIEPIMFSGQALGRSSLTPLLSRSHQPINRPCWPKCPSPGSLHLPLNFLPGPSFTKPAHLRLLVYSPLSSQSQL